MTDQTAKSAPKNLIAEHSGTIIFVLLAAGIFIALYLAYEYFFVGTANYYHYLDFCGGLASQFLTLIGVDHLYLVTVESMENLDISSAVRTTIKSDDLGARIVINDGTDAGSIFAIIIAVIAAWPGSLLKKTIAAAVGIAFIFVLNILRIAGMFLVDIHAPLQFDLYQGIIFPIALIAAALLYFLAWIRISGTHPDD